MHLRRCGCLSSGPRRSPATSEPVRPCSIDRADRSRCLTDWSCQGAHGRAGSSITADRSVSFLFPFLRNARGLLAFRCLVAVNAEPGFRVRAHRTRSAANFEVPISLAKETSNSKSRTRNHILLELLDSRSSHPRSPQELANFGTETLVVPGPRGGSEFRGSDNAAPPDGP